METHVLELIRRDTNISCALCKSDDVDDPYVSTNCCQKLFHEQCLKEYREYNVLCPSCEKSYKCLNLNELGINYIINGKISYDDLIDIYAVIKSTGQISNLYQLDQRIHEECADYNQYYKGYFPLSKLDNIMHHAVTANFISETYGIFERFCWDDFVMCGAFLAKLSVGANQSSEPFYFILHSKNYKLIRKRLHYFCKYISERFITKAPVPVSIQKNRIIFYIPGFERGIVLYVNMTDDLSTIMSNMEFYTNGIYYNGKDTYVTISGLKGIKGNNFCKKPNVKHCMSYEQDFYTFQNLNNDLQLIDTQLLYDAVFGKYILNLHLNDTKRVHKCIYKEWYENTDLNKNMDVDYQPNADKYGIFITAPDGSRHDFKDVIVSVHVFQKFVNNIIYANRTISSSS